MKNIFWGTFEDFKIIQQTGCQAVTLQNGLSIWFWGTIYNTDLWRSEFKGDYPSFVLNLFSREGPAVFAQMDGSFTFIIRTPEEIMICRDHHGTGLPFFYSHNYFASSLQQFVQNKNFHAEPNHQALAIFLTRGYIPVPETAFKNISKLGGGNLLIYRKNRWSIRNLFETEQIQPTETLQSLEDLSEEYGRLHRESIQRRIKGKDGIGILLSGGYDSGSNLAALRQVYNGDIHSFSIGFKGDNWTELPLARCMSKTFGTKHSEYEIDGSEISELPKIVEFLGEPFVEGGLMVNYAVMRMANKNPMDIILGGDGSDQYFGTSGREIALHSLLARNGLMPAARFIHTLLSNSHLNNNYLYRVNFQLDKIVGIMNGDYFGLPNSKLQKMLINNMHHQGTNNEKPTSTLFENLYTKHLYKTDIEGTINQVILFKASRMAAMFENDIAFPFMDLSLYEFLQKLPVQYKYKTPNLKEAAKGNATSKYLLKYHYKPLLPEEITTKKKQGGFAPMPLFFSNKSRRNEAEARIMNSSLVQDYLKRNEVEHFLKQYDREAEDSSLWFWYRQNKAIQYFNLYTLAIWWDAFIK